MVNYSNLGYNSLEEYLDDFLETLLISNHTHEFYVNWKKVFDNLEEHIIEINILNSLNKVSSDNVESKFKEIIVNYPEVVPILPLILAIRLKKVPIFDLNSKQSKLISFSKDSFDVDEILNFSKNSGLLKLFNNIDDLYSYLVGTEVGLDTNARKNRSGHIFEDIVGLLLNEKIRTYNNFKLVKEDNNIPIDRIKRFDYVIYKNNDPIMAFECNFYNSTGSKPIEVAHAYSELQRELDDNGIVFIWVTDGQGWKKMFSTLKNVSNNIEYIVNYTILNERLKYLLD